MLNANAMIKIEPVALIKAILSAVKNILKEVANSVKEPWYTRIETAENATPTPNEAVNNIAAIKSSMDLV